MRNYPNAIAESGLDLFCKKPHSLLLIVKFYQFEEARGAATNNVGKSWSSLVPSWLNKLSTGVKTIGWNISNV
jgi:hypothetical protein